MALNEKQRRFAEEYAATSNAAEAARRAGYSERTARAQGARLLTNEDIRKYVRQLQDEAAAGRIASMTQVQAFWSDTMSDPTERTADRLKASELLAKAGGAFLHPERFSDDIPLAYGEMTGGEDVVIYIPRMKTEEECMWTEEKINE